MYTEVPKKGLNPPLQGKRVYLSGPIEHGSEANWRIAPKKILIEEFGVELLDPFADEKQKWTTALYEAQKKSDFPTMRKIASGFVRKDLCWVDRCDFLIAYLPYKVPTTGTHHEIINGNNAKKPTLLICPEGKQYVPLWYYGFVGEKDDDYMFDSWDELYEYLRQVNNWEHTENDEWAYTYGLI